MDASSPPSTDASSPPSTDASSPPSGADFQGVPCGHPSNKDEAMATEEAIAPQEDELIAPRPSTRRAKARERRARTYGTKLRARPLQRGGSLSEQYDG